MKPHAFLEKLVSVMPVLPYMALGIWLAWGWLALIGAVWLSAPDINERFVTQFSVIYSISCGSTLILAGLFWRKAEPLLNKSWFVFLGGAIVALGAVGVLLAGPSMLSPLFPPLAATWLFWSSCVLTGIGSSAIVSKCAQLYGRLLPRNAIMQASFALIVAVATYFIAMGFPQVRWADSGPMLIGSLAFVLLPLLAAWMLHLARFSLVATTHDKAAPSDGGSLSKQDLFPAAFLRMVVVAMLLIFASGMATGYVDSVVLCQDSTTYESGIVLMQLFVAMVFVALAIAYNPERTSLGRIFAAIMVLAAFFVVLSPAAGTYYTGYYHILPFAVQVFDFVFRCLLFFVIYQRRMASSRVFGLGYGLLMLADGLGTLVGRFALAPILSLSQAQFVSVILALASLGADFMLFSNKDFEELFENVHEGEEALSDLMSRRIESGVAIESHVGKFGIAVNMVADEYNLSRRERDVLRCLAMGYDAQKTAETLTISWNTVRTHTKNIYAKLDVHSRQEAADVVDRYKNM